MPALYTITTRASGTILTAAIYNADHQNHVNNGDAAHLGGFSSNTSQMRTQVNPGDVGSESLAISISDELARIRYMIALQRGTTFWYGTIRTSQDGLNYFRNSDLLNFSRQGQANKSYAASAGDPYTADCFYVHNNANQALLVGPGAALAVTDIQSLFVQRVAGQTGIQQMWIGQPFTLAQLIPLRGKTVTVSFSYFAAANFAATNISAILSTGTGAAAAKIAGLTGRVDQSVASFVPSILATTRISGQALIPVNATQMDIIVVWTPVGTAGAQDTIVIGEFKLEEGNTPTPYVHPDPIAELDELAFFYWKTFALGTVPATAAGFPGSLVWNQSIGASLATLGNNVRFTRRMRTTPSIVLFNPISANALGRNSIINADTVAATAVNIDESACGVNFTTAVGSAAGQANNIHLTAEAGI